MEQEHKTSFISVMRNPHFVQLASFIHVPFMEFFWSANHPEIPAKGLIHQMSKIVFRDGPLTQLDKTEFLKLFSDFASQVVMKDLRLHYSVADMEWLINILDSAAAKVTLSLLFAAASAKETLFTPAEVAELLGENEVVWRRKAKAYEIPGTIKKSRGYLIPLMGLQSVGLLMDYRPSREKQEEPEPAEDDDFIKDME